jgi:antitoxin component YwqK of YwqJK toxin-antitoxin module
MVYEMKSIVLILGLFFLGIQLLLGSENSLEEAKIESQLINSMLNEAYRGKWHKMANKTIPYDGFKLRGGKLFLESKDIPFTGWYAQFDQFNEPRLLCSFQDGIKHGFIYMWGANGIRRMQGEYNQNNRHGEFLEWNQFGVLISSRQYRSNKLHGDSTFWYGSGKVRLESYFLYGHIIDAQGWFPDGNPCPYSRVTNGKGLVLRYDENFSNEGTPTGILQSTFNNVDGGKLEPKLDALIIVDQ